MKYINLKTKSVLFFALLAFGFASCDKVESNDPIGDKGQKIIGFIQYGSIDNFGKASLVFDSSLPLDSFELRLQYNGPVAFTNDVTVTIGTDVGTIATYNSTVPAGGIKFNILPTTMYSYPSTTATFKKGNSISEPFIIYFKPDQFDPAVSYMLPVKITGISGAPSDVVPAAGTGLAYLHIIGNPLAGNYQDFGVRWSLTGAVAWTGPGAAPLATAPGVPAPANLPAGATGTPSYTYNYITSFLPVDAQTVHGYFGNVPLPGSSAGSEYLITGNASFSAITYDFGSAFNSGYSNIQKFVTAYNPPTAGKPAFRLITKYNNAVGNAGSDRYVDESFGHL